MASCESHYFLESGSVMLPQSFLARLSSHLFLCRGRHHSGADEKANEGAAIQEKCYAPRFLQIPPDLTVEEGRFCRIDFKVSAHFIIRFFKRVIPFPSRTIITTLFSFRLEASRLQTSAGISTGKPFVLTTTTRCSCVRKGCTRSSSRSSQCITPVFTSVWPGTEQERAGFQ